MKNILEKYKIPLISSGILLSIIVSVPIINSNFSKEDVTKNQIELKAASIVEVAEDDNYEIKDNKVLIEIEENIENNNSEDNSVGNLATLTVEDTASVTKVKEEASSIQTKESNIKTSSPITAEKYVVKKGDTLFLIAQRANISTNQLKQLNNLSSDVIYENQTLNIKGTVNNDTPSQVATRGSERSEDLYWLSRIIHSEAQGESYEGKVAVGNVIMNRVSSSQFPNTIKGVVFDKQHGYTQFSPVIDGTIYNTPGADSIRAATEVLNGARPVGNALYFLNPRKATNFWIVQNRKLMMTIGLHDFYY